jgi:hypothetical protein
VQTRSTPNTQPRHAAVDLLHAGAGTTLVGSYLALIPGVLPLLALCAVVAVVIALPLLVLGLAGAVVVLPAYAVWRLVRRQGSRHSAASSSI